MSLQQQLKQHGYQQSPPPPNNTNRRIRRSWKEAPDPNDDLLKTWLEETLNRSPRRVPKRREKPISLKRKGDSYIATISGGDSCWRGLAAEPGEAASRARILSHGHRPVQSR